MAPSSWIKAHDQSPAVVAHVAGRGSGGAGPCEEVAAPILPWFGANPPEYEGFVTRHIVHWIQGVPSRGVTHSPKVQFTDPDIRAVAEAIQVLEHSRLLMRSPGERGHVGLTR